MFWKQSLQLRSLWADRKIAVAGSGGHFPLLFGRGYVIYRGLNNYLYNGPPKPYSNAPILFRQAKVNQHFVKPVTWAAGGMSYALMKHPAGLPCQARPVCCFRSLQLMGWHHQDCTIGGRSHYY